MIKRCVVAGCLIIFSFVFAVCSHFYVKNVSTQLESLLETALQGDLQEGSIMSENIGLALEKWNKHKNFIEIFLKDSVSDEMDKIFNEIEFFLNYGQSDSLRQSAAKCIILLKSATGREKFSFSNIF